MSRGAAGSVWRARCGARGASGAARVAVADTVGAGDGHTAGFLHAYLAGASLEVRAARLCQARCAAAVTQHARVRGSWHMGVRRTPSCARMHIWI